MQKYLVGIELEYQEPITQPQIDDLVAWIRSLYQSPDTQLQSVQSAITQWPEGNDDRYLVKWRKYQGALVQTESCAVHQIESIGWENKASE